jgi:hypothetical protein
MSYTKIKFFKAVFINKAQSTDFCSYYFICSSAFPKLHPTEPHDSKWCKQGFMRIIQREQNFHYSLLTFRRVYLTGLYSTHSSAVGNMQRRMILTTQLDTAKNGKSVISRVCLKITFANLSVWKQFWILDYVTLLDRPLVVSFFVFQVRKCSVARQSWERLL